VNEFIDRVMPYWCNVIIDILYDDLFAMQGIITVSPQLHSYFNRIGDVIVSMLASSVVDLGFDPGQFKWYWRFSAK
jgi:hypothetical protein